jgi:hypothetical protein
MMVQLISSCLYIEKGRNMKKNLNALQVLLLAGLLSCTLPVAAAEAPADVETLEEFAPPAITNEDITKPEITVIERKGEKVEEYRVNGQLYMMKVTPKHGKPYYMHKEDQDSGWTMMGPNEPLAIPKWTLFRF